MSWIVASVIGLVGAIGITGLILGMRDPLTRPYKPRINGMFMIGRAWRSPAPSTTRDNGHNRQS